MDPGYPLGRGMTRVPELMAAGINVAFGHDCAMDPWYPLGSADMLEVAHMGLHVAQMTSPAQIAACFDAVTVQGARVLGLDRHGLAVGCDADLVLLQARSVSEAVRLRATRLLVLRRGAAISMGKGKPLDAQVHAVATGRCYAQQAERAPLALRQVGSTWDFTARAN
eukprot:gene3145-4459_t